MKRAVFLDRDGVINEDRGYVYRPEDFSLLPGAVNGLLRLQSAGYQLVIITNQSGIARGYYTEDDFLKLCRHMNGLFASAGIREIPVYHCPHLHEDCDCRKPKTGLFYRAAEELNLCFAGSWAIGDKERDLAICEREAVKGILITRDRVDQYLCCANLEKAAELILGVPT